MILRPQKGPQEQFLATKADIAIYGGAAGGGKTYALLLEPLRHMNVEGYSATIFRKNATQITIDGGLLDESMQNMDFYETRFTRQVQSLIGHLAARLKSHSCTLTEIETCLNGKARRFAF